MLGTVVQKVRLGVHADRYESVEEIRRLLSLVSASEQPAEYQQLADDLILATLQQFRSDELEQLHSTFFASMEPLSDDCDLS